MKHHALLAISLISCSLLSAAQTPVYETKGERGPVFSDQPSPGATRVDLPPPNVIQVPALPPQTPSGPASAAAPPPYGLLAITSPANEGTIHTNTGAFDLQVQVRPALRASGGDRIVVRLDGKRLAQGYASTSISITSDDWAKAATVNNVEHSLQVAIVDRSGAVLAESATVKFYAHRATR